MHDKNEANFDREFLTQFQLSPWIRNKTVKNCIKQRKKNQRRIPTSDLFNGLVLPREILVKIFEELDCETLVQCSFVCLQWKQIINEFVWKTKLHQILGHPIRVGVPIKYVRQFCFGHNFNVNLVQNPCGADGMKFWYDRNGESFEDTQFYFSDLNIWETCDIAMAAADDWIAEGAINKWFQINYDHLTWRSNQFSIAKGQWIELTKFGFPGEFLDQVQPPILVQDWYRFSWVGQNYSISMVLANENKHKLQEFHFSDGGNPTNRDRWTEVKHEFTNYGKGVRLVYIMHNSIQNRVQGPSAKISGTSTIISSNILRL